MKRKARERAMRERDKSADLADFRDHLGLVLACHFPTVEPGNFPALSCSECVSYRARDCMGDDLTGNHVVCCMIEKLVGGDPHPPLRLLN